LWMPGAPYLLMGLINALVLSFAIVVRKRTAAPT